MDRCLRTHAPYRFWILLLLAVLPSAWVVRAEEAGTPGEFRPFFFIVMADPQLGVAARDANFDEESRNFRAAIQAANRLHPAFVVILGDLINRTGDVRQTAAFLKLTEEFSGAFPVHLVPGNHDLLGAPTPASLESWRQTFGPDYYAFHHNGCRFLVINSVLASRRDLLPAQANAQFDWVRLELERAEQEGVGRVFVFQHQPWFLQFPREPARGILNVPLPVRTRYLELFRRYKVDAAFAGHLHANRMAADGAFLMITTASISRPRDGSEPGFRIVKVGPDAIAHEYVALSQVPESIVLDAASPSPTAKP